MIYAQYSNKLYTTTAVLDNKNLQASHSKIENKNHLQIKEAGIDVGTNNLAAIFINDEITPSLIVDGRKYKDYNFKFNQLIAGLNKNKMIQCTAERIAEYLYLNYLSLQ
jgi:putative transposase